MTKFKAGDVVRRVRMLNHLNKYYSGEPFSLTKLNRAGNWYDPNGGGHNPEYLELVVEESDGPVVTTIVPATTTKTIKPGIYDGLTVGTHQTEFHVYFYYAGYANKAQISKLIDHLTAVKDALKD